MRSFFDKEKKNSFFCWRLTKVIDPMEGRDHGLQLRYFQVLFVTLHESLE